MGWVVEEEEEEEEEAKAGRGGGAATEGRSLVGATLAARKDFDFNVKTNLLYSTRVSRHQKPHHNTGRSIPSPRPLYAHV